MYPSQKLFFRTFLVFGGVCFFALASSLMYRHVYTPLDYRLDSNYSFSKWQEHVYRQEGVSKLWGNTTGFQGAMPFGAYPYNTGGTVIFKFRYPFSLAEVTIEDQHSQWGEGDVVRRWTSVDGKTWILNYDDQARFQVVESRMVHQRLFRGKNTVYVKYDLYAGDPNRAANDNRGAMVRQLRVQAAFQNPLLTAGWNVIRYGLLPGLGILTVFLLLLTLTPGLTTLELGGIIFVFIAAAAFRLGFVTSAAISHEPLILDGITYNRQALNLLSFLEMPRQYWVQRNFEPITSLYGKSSPMHIIFLTGIYLLAGTENYGAVTICQALLDALTGVLVFFIGRSLGGRWAGMLATIGYACYFSFLVAADRLLQETLALFLLTLTIWLIMQLPERRSAVFGLTVGLCLGVTVLCRSALNNLLMPLSLLAVGGLFYKHKTDGEATRLRGNADAFARNDNIIRRFFSSYKASLFQTILMLTGIMLPVGAWLMLSVLLFQRPMMSSIQQHVYQVLYKIIVNQGWSGDQLHIAQGSLLDTLLQLRRHALPDANDFRDAILLIFKTHPIDSLWDSLSKLYYYWKIPYNDLGHTYFLPLPFQSSYHQRLVLLGLWGIVFALRAGYKSLVVVFPISYFAFIVACVGIDNRQTLTAFPFLIPLSAVVLSFLISRTFAMLKAWNARTFRLAGLLATSLSLGLLAANLTEPALLSLFQGLSAPGAHGFSLGLINLFWSVCGVLIYYLFPPVTPDGRRSMHAKVSAFAPVLLMVLVYNTHLTLAPEWREWKVRLDSPQLKIRQRLGLPETLPEFTEAYLKFDLQGSPARNYDLVIALNGQEIKRYQHGLTADEETVNYLTMVHWGAYQPYLRGERKSPDDVRQWFSVPVERAALLQQKFLEIEMTLQNLGSPQAYVELYGDYPQEALQPLPAFGLGTTKTSFFKYTVDHDFRLWTQSEIKDGNTPVSQIKFNSNISRDGMSHLIRWQRYRPPLPIESTFFNGTSWSEADLSRASGRQFGQYRIRLVLKDAAGNFLVL